jgi:hypothetical protein
MLDPDRRDCGGGMKFIAEGLSTLPSRSRWVLRTTGMGATVRARVTRLDGSVAPLSDLSALVPERGLWTAAKFEAMPAGRAARQPCSVRCVGSTFSSGRPSLRSAWATQLRIDCDALARTREQGLPDHVRREPTQSSGAGIPAHRANGSWAWGQLGFKASGCPRRRGNPTAGSRLPWPQPIPGSRKCGLAPAWLPG